jgi:hypothetical protein
MSSSTKKNKNETFFLLTVTVLFETVLDLLTGNALLCYLLSKKIASGYTFPPKVLGEEQRILLSARTRWSHQKYSLS